MAKIIQIGISFPHRLSSGIGHVACTLGGINYESRGGVGCLRGPNARGATNNLFFHHFFRVLSNSEGHAAKEYAERCVGQPYVWGGVPTGTKGGDCSGYMSGIICAAEGVALRRRFGTGTWSEVFADLGFKEGLGPKSHGFGRQVSLSELLGDIRAGRTSQDISRIQKALNREVGADLMGTGLFGPRTTGFYSDWQHKLGFTGSVSQPGSDADGMPGGDSLAKLGFAVID